MRDIKTKTYNNFMRVVKIIEGKGYAFDEAVSMAHGVFNQYEACPNGLSVLALVNRIMTKEAFTNMYS